jgi:hypothetical protein
MQEISLLDAWNVWFSGGSVASYNFLGMDILWWGRIGKIMEFVSALAIIAEIVGHERLRVFGKSLHGRFTIDRAGRLFRECILWWKCVLVYVLHSGERGDEAMDKGKETKVNKVNYLTCSLLTACIVWFYYLDKAWYVIIIAAAIAYFLLLLTLSPIVTFILVVSYLLLGLLVDSLLIEPLAWMLERESFDRVIKVVSLLLLATGFHFDLLAS